MENLPQWTAEPNKAYGSLSTMYSEVLGQYNRYAGHVMMYIGGIYQNPKTIEQQGAVYTYVDKAKQQEAMDFIVEHYIATPEWIFNDSVLSKTGTGYAAIASDLSGKLVRKLLQDYRFVNLVEAENALGKDNAYTIEKYFADLNNAIFSELGSRKEVDMYKRILQKTYVDHLLNMLPIVKKDANSAVVIGYNPAIYDVGGVVYYQLKALEAKLKNATSKDMVSDAHYKFLYLMIKQNVE